MFIDASVFLGRGVGENGPRTGSLKKMNMVQSHEMSDTLCETQRGPTNSHSAKSLSSRRTSQRSVVSDIRIKLLETERLQQETLVRLQKAEEKRLVRAKEEAGTRQIAEYQREVEAERKLREIRNEIERQQLNSEVYRNRLARLKSDGHDKGVVLVFSSH